MKLFFQTFGCKANQYDTEVIARALIKEGHLLVSNPAEADIQVVNTCAVTRRAETKAARYIRRIGREFKGTYIIAVGCAVERDPECFNGMEGVCLSLGVRNRFNLSGYLSSRAGRGSAAGASCLDQGTGITPKASRIPAFRGRKRAYLKIQDGCDYQCSYCIIPRLRGRSVSRSPNAILREALELVEAGFREIVLTGIHIGLYGRDLSENTSLYLLLNDLLNGTTGARFRLSSLDTREISADLIGLMAREDRLCNHLHVPMQSGSPRILKAMNRRGSLGLFLEVCARAVEDVPCLGLGTDIIVGFPGETEKDFEATCRIVQETPFSYVHIFPYSDRPGTPACRLKGEAVPGHIIRQRARVLKALALGRGREYREGLIGAPEEVVVERSRGDVLEGRCSNYLKAFFKDERIPVGESVKVRIEGIEGDGVAVSTEARGEIGGSRWPPQ